MLWLAFKLFWSAVMCRQSVDFRPLFDKECKLSVSQLFTINKFRLVHAASYICSSTYRFKTKKGEPVIITEFSSPVCLPQDKCLHISGKRASLHEKFPNRWQFSQTALCRLRNQFSILHIDNSKTSGISRSDHDCRGTREPRVRKPRHFLHHACFKMT